MRQQHLLSVCLSLAGFAAMGCAHTNAPPQDSVVDVSVRRDAVCQEAVRLYSSHGEVGAAFQEVAFLDYAEQSRMVNEVLLMNSVRRKAAELGATGVILPAVTDAEAGAQVVAAVLGAGTERSNRSIAVYVPSDSARVRAMCDSKRN